MWSGCQAFQRPRGLEGGLTDWPLQKRSREGAGPGNNGAEGFVTLNPVPLCPSKLSSSDLSKLGQTMEF